MADELQVRLTTRDELTGKLKDVRAAVRKATDDLTELNKHLDTDAGKKAYDDARRSLSELSLQEKRLRTEMGRNERAIKDMASTNDKSMTKMGRAVDRVRKKFGGMSDDAKKWAKRAAAGMAAAVGAAGVQSIRLAGDFEQSQSILQGSSGATAKQMEALKKLAMDMGAKTSYSAQDASNAMVDLSKAGLTVKQIMGGGVQAAMSLAATEGIDMGKAAETAANAMAMFGLKAKDLPRVADALAGGSNASTASVASLAQALSQVGPGAKNAGLSLNDTVGVLALFDQKGIKGSDAGTSLKTMLARLVPQTQKAANEMEALGIISYDGATAMKKLGELGVKPLSAKYDDVRAAVAKYVTQTQGLTPGSREAAKATDKMMNSVGAMNSKFIDSKGNFESVTTIAGVLKDKLGGLTQEQRTSALATMFGSDATRAATILMNEGETGLAKYIKATQKKGAAEKMAEKRTKTFKGQMEAFKGAVETIGIEIGLSLLPKLTKWTKWGTNEGIPMAKRFGKWIGQNKTSVIALVAAIAGIWASVKVIQTITTVSKAYGDTLKVAGKAVEWLKNKHIAAAIAEKARLVASKAALIATKAWTAAQWAFNAAMSANPIVLIGIAIVALVALFVLAYKKVGWFRDAVNAAWAWIKRTTASFVGWFKSTAWPAIKVVIGYIAGYYKTLWKGIKIVWAGIKDAAAKFVGWFKSTAWPAIKFVVGAIKDGFSGIWTTAKRVWKGISDTVSGAVKGIKTVAGGIGKAFSGVWDGITGAAKAAFNGVARAWNSTIGSLSFTVPDWVPGIGGKGWSVPNIALLAKGGPVTAGLRAIVGEVGPELFVPAIGRPRVIGSDGPEILDFAVSGVVIPNHLMPQVPANVVRQREVVMAGSGGPTIQTGDIYATSNVDVEAALIHAEMRRTRIANERRAGGRR